MDPTALLTLGLISGEGGTGGQIIIRYFDLDIEGELQSSDFTAAINTNDLEAIVETPQLSVVVEFAEMIGEYTDADVGIDLMSTELD